MGNDELPVKRDQPFGEMHHQFSSDIMQSLVTNLTDTLADHVILRPTNDELRLNKAILQHISGETRTYFSSDDY